MPVRRTCIGCRQVRPVTELFRVTRQSDARLAEGRTLPGRGAWLCAGSPACIDLAGKRKAFSRALRGPVGQDSIESLRAAMVERARIGRDADHGRGD
ncbi:MAG: YlxR family protein [Actinobacteria bacterium]|nr:YlxR family protein [Actinomycetota bacterium]MBI3257790.1 YlxR family protein [Actinomycetota bacterium]